MRIDASTATALALALTLGACVETDTGSGTALRSGSGSDESACLSAVAAETGNSVRVLSSEFSQAATVVMVGVGPESAPWRCLVSGGVVTEVISTTNEGAL